MISVDSLLYEIDLKLNNLTSLEHQEIPLENKLILINEAQHKLVKQKIRQTEDNPIGLDGDKKRYHDIQGLIEPSEKHPFEPELVDKRLNKWSFPLEQFSPKFMFFISGYMIANKGACKKRVLYINPNLAKHADVSLLLNNSNFRPSFEWHETFNTISDNKLEIYTDGTFEFTEGFMSYIRYPRDVDQEGYIKFDGSDSKKVDSELEDYLKDELLNLITVEISIITEKQSGVQAFPLRKAESE